MNSKIFIDSNIFLYALDRYDQKRRETVKIKLASVSNESRIVVSTQVLNEVYAVSTRKLGVDPLAAKDFIRQLGKFDVLLVTPGIISSAIDCSILNKTSYWDALMIATAEEANCDVLWTEDLSHGQVIRGVRIENPLLDRD